MRPLKKKGVEIALNTVIIAAILLIVLLVVLFIFGNSSGKFSTTVASCLTKGGVCKDMSSDNPCTGPTVPNTDCEKKNPPMVCCLSV